MSDTYAANDSDQSIDDERDTATGGLQNDMPSLPAQPPSGPGVRPPSPLAAIAQLFSGRPAPQPASPGPSPWDAPGRSQIPQGPAGGPQSHQNASRWMGTTGSLALPQGSMQPQANFTPFMRSPPTTSHRQWGQTEPYPNLPQSFEVPGLLNSTASFFGQNGSNAIIPLALSMGKNGGAFLEAVMKGQEWAAKERRQKLKDDAAELAARQAKEMYVYKDIADEYADKMGATSAEAAKNYSINGETLLDALANQAMELGDDKFLAVLGTGSVDKAMQFLHHRNENWGILDKANKAQEKQDAEDASYNDIPGAQQTNPGRINNPADNFGQPQQPAAPQRQAAPGQPAPTMQPGQPAKLGEPTQVASADNSPSGINPDQAPYTDTRTPGQKVLDQGALDLARGDKPTGGEFGSPATQAKFGRRRLELEEALGEIAGDPSITTPQQAFERIRQVAGPEVAQEFMGMANYQSGPGVSGSAQGGSEQKYYQLMGSILTHVMPGDENGVGAWNKNFYNAQQSFRNNNQTRTVIQRGNSLAADGQAVLDDISLMHQVAKEQGIDDTSIDLNRIADKFGTDWRVIKFQSDWLAYNDAFNTVVTGGRHVEGGTQQQVNVAPTSYGSLAAFRGAIKGHMNDAIGYYDAERTTWRSIGGRDGNMPSFDPEAYSHLHAIRDMDPRTGALPGDTVWPLNKATGKRDTPFIYTGRNINPSNPSNYMTPNQWKQYLKANKPKNYWADPDAESRIQPDDDNAQ